MGLEVQARRRVAFRESITPEPATAGWESDVKYHRRMNRSLVRRLVLCSVLAVAESAGAQVGPSANAPPSNADGVGEWVPLGPLPVDQAGAGLRGYTLPAEG